MRYLTFKSSFLFIQRDWDLCFPVIRQFVEAVAADRFVGVLGAQHHLLLVAGETVRMVGEVAAAHADGVHLVTYSAVAISAGIGPKGFPV